MALLICCSGRYCIGVRLVSHFPHSNSTVSGDNVLYDEITAVLAFILNLEQVHYYWKVDRGDWSAVSVI